MSEKETDTLKEAIYPSNLGIRPSETLTFNTDVPNNNKLRLNYLIISTNLRGACEQGDFPFISLLGFISCLAQRGTTHFLPIILKNNNILSKNTPNQFNVKTECGEITGQVLYLSGVVKGAQNHTPCTLRGTEKHFAPCTVFRRRARGHNIVYTQVDRLNNALVNRLLPFIKR